MIESTHYTQEFYAEQQGGSLSSAMVVLPLVQQALQPASVVDIGCGVGHWLSVWYNQLGVKDLQGVEGPYVTADLLKIPKHLVHFQDLKQPLPINRRFDLAMSLEVAEHLPATFAAQFVNTLTSLSDVVLFSAAIPGQEGTYHINEQLPEYWAGLFKQHGYVPVDFIRPQVWGKDDAVAWWYQQNVLIYIKEERLKEFPALTDAYVHTDPSYLMRVHPWLYNYKLEILRKTSSFIGFIRWTYLYPVKKFVRKKLNPGKK
jgi:SAM-dependent methyltransferase